MRAAVAALDFGPLEARAPRRSFHCEKPRPLLPICYRPVSPKSRLRTPCQRALVTKLRLRSRNLSVGGRATGRPERARAPHHSAVAENVGAERSLATLVRRRLHAPAARTTSPPPRAARRARVHESESVDRHGNRILPVSGAGRPSSGADAAASRVRERIARRTSAHDLGRGARGSRRRLRRHASISTKSFHAAAARPTAPVNTTIRCSGLMAPIYPCTLTPLRKRELPDCRRGIFPSRPASEVDQAP